MKRRSQGVLALAAAAGLLATAALPASAAPVTGPPTASVQDVLVNCGADGLCGAGGDDVRKRTLTVSLRGVTSSYWVRYQDVDNSASFTLGDIILATGSS
jgi:hypothetical protein